jgi:nitrite reductase/ring-hydroxylating ferredoxin subunit
MKEVQIDGKDVCIANVDGKYYAIGNVCTHMGSPLAEGSLRVMKFNAHGMDLDLTLEMAKLQV